MSEALHVYEGLVTTFQVASDRVRDGSGSVRDNVGQFGLLRRVSEDELVSLTELASRLGCTNANITPLVDNVVKAGLIEKLRHPSDQRIALIRLTALGSAVRGNAGASYSRAVDECVPQLGAEERTALLALRSRLR
jgi:DNA-binding MarR family transcriptional regulator